MSRSISTSISDLVLSASAFHAALRLFSSSFPAAFGFAIIGTAAALGTLRFASTAPSHELISWHKYWSWLSSALGLSLLAAAYHRQHNLSVFANAHTAMGIALGLLRPYLAERTISIATEGVSTVAVLSILILNVIQFNALGLIGAVMYAISGLVIGTEGEWQGIPRVDIFHYALVIGNIGFMMGLNTQPAPIYYRPSN